LALLIYKRRNL